MTGFTLDSIDVTVTDCVAAAHVGHGVSFSPGAARLRTLVSRLTWWPGSAFQVKEGPDGVTLYATFDTICARRGGASQVQGDVTWTHEVVDRTSDRGMLEGVRLFLHQLAVHEADEWLCLDGTRHPFDPHRMPADPSPFPPRRRLSHPWSKV